MVNFFIAFYCLLAKQTDLTVIVVIPEKFDRKSLIKTFGIRKDHQRSPNKGTLDQYYNKICKLHLRNLSSYMLETNTINLIKYINSERRNDQLKVEDDESIGH